MSYERKIFSSDNDNFLQEYCMYFKKNWLSMTEKEPFRRRFGGYRTGLIFTMLDGSPEEQRRSTEKFLSMLTEEEKERAMSSEFDYLDED